MPQDPRRTCPEPRGAGSKGRRPIPGTAVWQQRKALPDPECHPSPQAPGNGHPEMHRHDARHPPKASAASHKQAGMPQDKDTRADGEQSKPTQSGELNRLIQATVSTRAVRAWTHAVNKAARWACKTQLTKHRPRTSQTIASIDHLIMIPATEQTRLSCSLRIHF